MKKADNVRANWNFSMNCFRIIFYWQPSWPLDRWNFYEKPTYVKCSRAAGGCGSTHNITQFLSFRRYLNNELVHFENKCYTQRVALLRRAIKMLNTFKRKKLRGKALRGKCSNISYSWHIANVLKYSCSLNSFHFTPPFIFYLLTSINLWEERDKNLVQSSLTPPPAEKICETRWKVESEKNASLNRLRELNSFVLLAKVS